MNKKYSNTDLEEWKYEQEILVWKNGGTVRYQFCEKIVMFKPP
jgi:hypothetical protein